MLRSVHVATILALVSFLTSQGSSQSIRGVNLGGWLLTEQWITPSLYSSTNTDDEWNLCNHLGKDKCSSRLENHWKSFITRSDLEEIASVGLNAIRIPIGYWSVDLLPYEPYVSGQYPYLSRAVQWARELGLHVLIDLHGAPGSQNGQDNSGLIGPVLFPSNATNAERVIGVLRNLTEEFGGDAYGGVVTGIELLNEPRLSDPNFPTAQLKDFYSNATSAMLAAKPSGPRSTMDIVIHDAFYGPTYWQSYDTDQNLTIDTHQYYAFAPLNDLSQSQMLASTCSLARTLHSPLSSQTIPRTIVGEFGLETNISPSVSTFPGAKSDDQARRTWYRLLFEAQVRAYSPSNADSNEEQVALGWYFWTWKTEYDIDTWSYRRGVRDGWIPGDIANASSYVYPLGDDGCVDAGFEYVAPLHAGAATGRSAGMGWMAEVAALVIGIWMS